MFEREEWRNAVAALTEMERVATQIEVRAAMGLCGEDPSDITERVGR